MSEHWTIFCDDCLVYGPDIRRSGSFNIWTEMPRRHPELRDPQTAAERPEAQEAWASFMAEHGYHHLMLVHE